MKIIPLGTHRFQRALWRYASWKGIGRLPGARWNRCVPRDFL